MSDKNVIQFKRLYFKESRNKRGERCFISKVMKHIITGEDKKVDTGDVIIVANLDSTPIDRAGRWDVTTRKMFSGDGFIVTDAKWCADEVDMQVDFINHKVSVVINGSVGRYKKVNKETSKVFFTDLEYHAGKKNVTLNKLLVALEDKQKFLQLPPHFSYVNFVADFIKTCEAIREDYKFINGGFYKNTPMADALKDLKE